jgi:hypothetical protein
MSIRYFYTFPCYVSDVFHTFPSNKIPTPPPFIITVAVYRLPYLPTIISILLVVRALRTVSDRHLLEYYCQIIRSGTTTACILHLAG